MYQMFRLIFEEKGAQTASTTQPITTIDLNVPCDV